MTGSSIGSTFDVKIIVTKESNMKEHQNSYFNIGLSSTVPAVLVPFFLLTETVLSLVGPEKTSTLDGADPAGWSTEKH